MLPNPSYGRVIRQMLAGQFCSGLVPFEVFLIEILSRPALIDRWCVPIVMAAAPVELVMSQRMMKQIQPADQCRSGSSIKSVVIGIESRNSLTRHQFIAWQRSHQSLATVKPVFKMLPMELMEKAMQAETIDGFLVPTPWGMALESGSEGRMVTEFKSGKLSQQLVLCCHRNVVEAAPEAWITLPERIGRQRRMQIECPPARDRAIKAMTAMGRPHCDESALVTAAERYLESMVKTDFIPEAAWLSKQIEKLARLIPSVARFNSLDKLADSLAFVQLRSDDALTLPGRSSILDC
jgi:hypothetical protein